MIININLLILPKTFYSIMTYNYLKQKNGDIMKLNLEKDFEKIKQINNNLALFLKNYYYMNNRWKRIFVVVKDNKITHVLSPGHKVSKEAVKYLEKEYNVKLMRMKDYKE